MTTRVDRKRLKKSLDMIILSFLEVSKLDAEDLAELIYRNFRRYFSEDTIKEILFSLEKNKLVASETLGRKKTYSITKNGRNMVKRASGLLKKFGL